MDAFRLTRIGPDGSPADVTLAVHVSASTATQTIARLTFCGALTEFGSLTDGLYRLTILSAKVSGSRQSFDGDANSTAGGDFTLDLHRLYGDVNGDKTVNGLDLAAFRVVFGSSAGHPAFAGLPRPEVRQGESTAGPVRIADTSGRPCRDSSCQLPVVSKDMGLLTTDISFFFFFRVTDQIGSAVTDSGERAM